MKPLRVRGFSLRWRAWSIGVCAVAVCAGAGWGIPRWRHHRAAQQSIRILEDLRVIDAASTEPLDLVSGHSHVCEVHGVEMSVSTIPVLYGCLERSTRNSLAVRLTPHARWPYEGGCLVRSAPVARAYVCPECVIRAASIPESAIYADDASTAGDLNAFWQPRRYSLGLDFPKPR